MRRRHRRAYRKVRQQIAEDLESKFQRQSIKVARRIGVTLMFLTKFEVRRRPPKKTAAALSIFDQLAPPSVALLLPMTFTCRQEGWMLVPCLSDRLSATGFSFLDVT